MSILAYIKNNKQKSVMIVISISVLLGVFVVRKVTISLPYLIEKNGWSSSLPAWFDPYGVAVTGLLTGAILVVLINWTFRKFVKELEQDDAGIK
jgi:hypothetical protein